jgi:hypothetical protein
VKKFLVKLLKLPDAFFSIGGRLGREALVIEDVREVTQFFE